MKSRRRNKTDVRWKTELRVREEKRTKKANTESPDPGIDRSRGGGRFLGGLGTGSSCVRFGLAAHSSNYRMRRADASGRSIPTQSEARTFLKLRFGHWRHYARLYILCTTGRTFLKLQATRPGGLVFTPFVLGITQAMCVFWKSQVAHLLGRKWRGAIPG